LPSNLRASGPWDDTGMTLDDTSDDTGGNAHKIER
jgi:hypothetical protein